MFSGMGLFDTDPIYSESLQNYSMGNLRRFTTSELLEEYDIVLKEKKDALEEIESLKDERANTYSIQERLENSKKSIDDIEYELKQRKEPGLEKKIKAIKDKYEKKQ